METIFSLSYSLASLITEAGRAAFTYQELQSQKTSLIPKEQNCGVFNYKIKKYCAPNGNNHANKESNCVVDNLTILCTLMGACIHD